MLCPACGTRNAPEATHCAHCGADFVALAVREARLARARGDLHHARQQLERAVTLAPDHVEALLEAGLLFEMLGDLSMAERRLSEALALNGSLSTARAALARIYSHSGAYDAALPLYQDALNAEPTSAELAYGYAVGLAATGRAHEAIGFYERAITYRPEFAAAYLGLARVLMTLGDQHGAAASLQNAISIDPHLAEAYGDLGIVTEALGDRHNAISHYERAVALAPQDHEWLLRLARALHTTGDLARAAQLFERALTLVPDDVETLSELGSLRLETGDFDGAVAAFSRALDRDGGNATALRGKARALMARQRSREAAELLQRLVSLHPDSASDRVALGDALRAHDAPAEAAHHYRLATELAPGMSAAWYGLGLSCIATHEIDRAIASLQRLLALDPHHMPGHEALQSAYQLKAEHHKSQISNISALGVTSTADASPGLSVSGAHGGSSLPGGGRSLPLPPRTHTGMSVPAATASRPMLPPRSTTGLSRPMSSVGSAVAASAPGMAPRSFEGVPAHLLAGVGAAALPVGTATSLPTGLPMGSSTPTTGSLPPPRRVTSSSHSVAGVVHGGVHGASQEAAHDAMHDEREHSGSYVPPADAPVGEPGGGHPGAAHHDAAHDGGLHGAGGEHHDEPIRIDSGTGPLLLALVAIFIVVLGLWVANYLSGAKTDEIAAQKAANSLVVQPAAPLPEAAATATALNAAASATASMQADSAGEGAATESAAPAATKPRGSSAGVKGASSLASSSSSPASSSSSRSRDGSSSSIYRETADASSVPTVSTKPSAAEKPGKFKDKEYAALLDAAYGRLELKKYEDAEREFRKAMDGSRDRAAAYIGLAETLKARGKRGEAKKMYELYIGRFPDGPEKSIALQNIRELK